MTCLRVLDDKPVLDHKRALGQSLVMAENEDLANLSFENALRELEGIVQRLERGDVPLDESIAIYTRGEALRAQCQARLADAEARIQKLTLDATGAVAGAQPFGAD
jgi:exodeoxyribonuclease VII small subunit